MPYIHLKNNMVEYKFSFLQKYLFVCGDSGIGKSSLVSLVDDYRANPEAIDCFGDNNIQVLHSVADMAESGKIFFLDENNPILVRGDSAKLFANSNNYFVIMTRSRRFDEFKAGLDSIVVMGVVDNVHVVYPKYPKKEHLSFIADTIVCEDSKSGKLFLETILGHKIASAASKDKFAVKLRKMGKKEYTIVYDRCGISFSYEDQMDYLHQRGIEIISELDWDSFESYVLESIDYNVQVPWFPDKESNAILLFKELFGSYDKSSLPVNMKYPIYGKVRDLVECDKLKNAKMNIFE